jgi:membrane protease YdiL (CAAX protease family)
MIRRDPEFMLFDLSVDCYSWRGLGLLAFVFLGATLFAAIFTPVLYALVVVWDNWQPNPTTAWLLGKNADVYFDRLRWLPILAGLPWLLAVCHLWSWPRLGLRWNLLSMRDFGRFFGVGVIMILTVGFFQMGFTRIEWDYRLALIERQGGTGDLLRHILLGVVLSSLAGGLIIGFLEEVIFRGLILRLFYTAFRPLWAATGVSLFFAYTHFGVPGSVWAKLGTGVEWYTGFIVAYWTLLGITVSFDILPFAVLFMLGLVLALLFYRTRSLMACIGLHCGLVFAMLLYRSLFSFPPDPARRVWGGGGFTDGWAILLILSLFALGLLISIRKQVHEQSRYC